jgi:hypothetical protein
MLNILIAKFCKSWTYSVTLKNIFANKYSKI